MEQYLISSMSKTHKFTHAISVIVRRSKGMFSDQPSWREYDKIKQCGAWFIGCAVKTAINMQKKM